MKTNTDTELEQFIESWIPINVKDAPHVKEAKVAARKEFLALIDQYVHEKELKLLEDIFNGYGMTAEDYEHWLAQLNAQRQSDLSKLSFMFGIPQEDLEKALATKDFQPDKETEQGE